MKILVTGATGFVGKNVINGLLETNHEIIATSHLSERLCDWPQRIKYIPADINEAKDNWYEFFNSPDIVIHLAWAGLPNYKSTIHFEQNLTSQIKFLKNLIDNGARDLSVTGTCFEYGMQEGELSETMDARPDNSYAMAKYSLYQYLLQKKKEVPFSLKWIRLFYLFGEGQNPNSLFSQLKTALKNNEPVFNMSEGKQKRDFLPISKAASNLVKISLQDEVSGIINCCSGKPKSVIDLVKEIVQESGKKIKLNTGYYPYPDYEPMTFWGNADKLTKILSMY